MRQLCSPVMPYRGLRTLDAFGSGGYGAPRDGGSRKHDGLDFVAVEGDQVVAPMDLLIVHYGTAYPDSNLGSIHLVGVGEFSGLRIKLLYCALIPSVAKGMEVPQGAQIALAQSVAAFYRAKHPDRGSMTNHIHEALRVFADGIWQSTDPTPWLMRSEAV